MKRISWNDPNAAEQLNALYNRPACPREVEQSVAEIVANVRENGDSAVCHKACGVDPSLALVEEQECPR